MYLYQNFQLLFTTYTSQFLLTNNRTVSWLNLHQNIENRRYSHLVLERYFAIRNKKLLLCDMVKMVEFVICYFILNLHWCITVYAPEASETGHKVLPLSVCMSIFSKISFYQTQIKDKFEWSYVYFSGVMSLMNKNKRLNLLFPH